MKEPQDAGKYQVSNDGTVQGQVTGDHATVHQHFYAAQDKATSSPTKPQRVWNIPATSPLSSIQRQNRERLLKRVRAIWIEGLLEQSLHRAAWIDLHLQEQPDALENPWRLEVQELNQAPRPLPIGTSIVEVCDKADGELLILGEPGAGKTTLLLELTRTLLERAEKDEQLPLPMVFNLSSWAEKRQPLRLWLVEELSTKYQVPRKIGKGWIDTDQVLPLLDGLDEVVKEVRRACVQQINDYYQSRLERGSSPIVVCCRSKEYAALSTCVMLQHAVSILPLTSEQINTYLEQAGEQVKALKQALDEDAELHSLACQPLMLNIFTLAYQGTTVAKTLSWGTHEEMRYTIFSTYVERMLKRREESKRWKPKLMLRWLTFLAKQMQRHGQAIFSLENLQPIWLSRRRKLLYYCCLELLRELVFIGLVGGLIGGLFGVLVGGLLMLVWWLMMGPVRGLVAELIQGRVGELVRDWIKYTDLGGIYPREALTWSWKRVLCGLVGGLSFWLVVGLVLGLVPALRIGLVGGLAIWLVGGLIWGLTYGLSGGQFPQRLSLSPNEGIWRSGKNGLVAGLVAGPIGGFILGLAVGPVRGLVAALIGGLLFWLVAGLVLGLETFVRHFILRFLLWWQGDLPWKLVPFLDEAAERLLLRKVGGSYVFVHRQLLDYFATLG